MQKPKHTHIDPLLGLLNFCNIPRDCQFGSPSHRLLSRRTRTTIPISEKQLKKKRNQQKKYYDKTAKDHDKLKANQVVRLETDKGFDRVGVVKGIADKPRSYEVMVDRRELVRNRKHLLPVNEPVPDIPERTLDALPPPANEEKPTQDS